MGANPDQCRLISTTSFSPWYFGVIICDTNSIPAFSLFPCSKQKNFFLVFYYSLLEMFSLDPKSVTKKPVVFFLEESSSCLIFLIFFSVLSPFWILHFKKLFLQLLHVSNKNKPLLLDNFHKFVGFFLHVCLFSLPLTKFSFLCLFLSVFWTFSFFVLLNIGFPLVSFFVEMYFFFEDSLGFDYSFLHTFFIFSFHILSCHFIKTRFCG